MKEIQNSLSEEMLCEIKVTFLGCEFRFEGYFLFVCFFFFNLNRGEGCRRRILYDCYFKKMSFSTLIAKNTNVLYLKLNQQQQQQQRCSIFNNSFINIYEIGTLNFFILFYLIMIHEKYTTHNIVKEHCVFSANTKIQFILKRIVTCKWHIYSSSFGSINIKKKKQN